MGTIADAAGLPSLRGQEPEQGQDIGNADAVGQEAMDNITEGVKQQKAAQFTQSSFNKITYKFNPKTGKYDVDISMPQDTFDTAQNLMQTGQKAQEAFQAARQQLAMKRVFQEQNPFVSAIGKIASTAAAQYATGPLGEGRGRNISPIIRAAGAYGLDQFGESPALLAEREAGLQAQEFGIANQLQNQAQQQQVIEQSAAREDRRERSDQTRFELSYMGQLNQQARDEAYSAADIPGLTEQIQKSGLVSSPEAAKSFAQGLVATSDARKRVREAEAKARLDADERRALDSERRFLAIQGRILNTAEAARSDKQAEKAQKDEDRLLLARGIVAGDPTSLNVYGTRTDGRAALLADVMRLDPKMTEAKINDRRKAYASLADQEKSGALGTQLSMYDTFIQHTDELDQLTAQLGGTKSPLLNKPLNTLRKEAEGNPILFRWLVVASAVNKEYQGVLLRGKALYKDDREEANAMLNLSVPARVILQTTQQQRKVAADRVIAAGNSWQRTTGRELPTDAISEEAKAIMERSGIKVPIEGTSGSKGGKAAAEATATANPTVSPVGTIIDINGKKQIKTATGWVDYTGK